MMDNETKKALFLAKLNEAFEHDKHFQGISKAAQDKIRDLLMSEIDKMDNPAKKFLNPFYVRRLKKEYQKIIDQDKKDHPEVYNGKS